MGFLFCFGLSAEADFLFLKSKPELRCETMKCEAGLKYVEKDSNEQTRVCGCQRMGRKPVPVGLWLAEDKESERRVHETHYDQEGQRHGIERHFDFETETLREEKAYFAGKLHGLRKHWNEEGEPSGMECFVDGEREPVQQCDSAQLAKHKPQSRTPASFK